jgi:hypothetical protein
MANSKSKEVISEVVEEDYLSVDNEIPGQGFVCLSFLSPNKILPKKEMFFFSEFMRYYESKIRFDAFEKYIAKLVEEHNESSSRDIEQSFQDFQKKQFTIESGSGSGEVSEDPKKGLMELQETVSSKSRIQITDIFEKFRQHLEEHRPAFASQANIIREYDDFMSIKGKDLEDKFHEQNDFQTTVQGLKVRGTYATHKEASIRAKKLQKSDPNHNVFVGQVGYWLPWDPNPEHIAEQEYADKELNELMKRYNENQEKKKELFETEKAMKIQKAKEENEKKKKDFLLFNDEANIRVTGVDQIEPTQGISGVQEAKDIMKGLERSELGKNPRKRMNETHDDENDADAKPRDE